MSTRLEPMVQDDGVHDFVRPRLVLSKCLELDPCRYNGQSIRAQIVNRMAPHVELVPVCPEVEIGLGVPRPPIRLVSIDEQTRLVQPETGRDLTDAMRRFGESFLDSVGAVDGFLLKSRSPSCGIKDVKIYGGMAKAPTVGRGAGEFAAAVVRRHPHAAVEDEGRLTNFQIRHHFLTRLFALGELRRALARGRVGALVEFHARHKLLLMAHSQPKLKLLGNLVAGARGRVDDVLAADYRDLFAQALARPARTGPVINVLMHAQGYFSDRLTAGEKRHFAGILGAYRSNRVALSAALVLLGSWIARFEQSYLASQRFFHPYPRELMEMRDSGGDLPML